MDYELIKPDKDDAYDPAPFLNYARARRTDKQERDPDIGDSVHFWDMVEAKCRAATVTGFMFASATQQAECLAVMDPDEREIVWRNAVPHDETKTGPSWHWSCGGH